jgi:Ca-activated chloride channel family protein
LAEAQSLPEDPVAGLIDIPLPPEVSLWPQTWTFRITIAVVVAAVVVAAWWAIRHWWTNRYRREALAELSDIENAHDSGTAENGLAADLALLVRRTALAAFPREQVAALAGPTWLSFLDHTYGGTEFSQGCGRVLESAPYQPPQANMNGSRALIELVRRWIKVHHA